MWDMNGATRLRMWKDLLSFQPHPQACMQMFFAECLIEARDFLSQSNCEKCHFENMKRSVSLGTRKYYSWWALYVGLGKCLALRFFLLKNMIFRIFISCSTQINDWKLAIDYFLINHDNQPLWLYKRGESSTPKIWDSITMIMKLCVNKLNVYIKNEDSNFINTLCSFRKQWPDTLTPPKRSYIVHFIII